MKTGSLYAIIVLFIVLFLLSQVYYPKWKMKGTEATISWDVAGYYSYLPAIFIYNDLRKCSFAPDIKQKYNPTPDYLQGTRLVNGNHVIQYSIGQAINFLPAFFTGHIWATYSDKYSADGFSIPYQYSLSIWSLLVALAGLYYLRKSLLFYYSDITTTITLILLVIGSNYLDYASITGAMTHNYLFTINALILYHTIIIYKNPRSWRFILIGILVGLAALTRPTEILICLVPLFWLYNPFRPDVRKEKITFFLQNKSSIFISILICAIVGSLQLFYWKYVSGNWTFYSYGDQGFSWLQPHIWNGLFSYKSGWLIYSPVMLFALWGFFFLYNQNRKIFYPVMLYFLIFTYVTFAWDIWWYGGSLGQRAMVQSYPVLAIPMASFITKIIRSNRTVQAGLSLIFLVFGYYNLWLTHQAHRGGLLHAGAMTKAYFWKILGTYEKHRDDVKLLDTNESFEGDRKHVSVLVDSVISKETQPLILNGNVQFSPVYNIPFKRVDGNWIRATVDVTCITRESNLWKMTQLNISFNSENNIVKNRMIRLQRMMEENERRNIYLDVAVPDTSFDEIEIKLWHAGSTSKLQIHQISVESFDE